MQDMTVIFHEVATDGLPSKTLPPGRVAFIFDGCVVSGWPLDPKDAAFSNAYERAGVDPRESAIWEGDSDVSNGRTFSGVTHWIEFPLPLAEIGVTAGAVHER